MNANVGIRSKADLVVTRNGVVVKELKDCGNMILDNFFIWWKEHAELIPTYQLNLGSSATPTTVDMTSLVTTLSGSKKDVSSEVLSTEAVDIDGVTYMEYRQRMAVPYSLGAVVGVVRELGISTTARNGYKGGVFTRIVLPEDFVLTAEDQLTVYYTFIARVKRKEEFTFTADLDGKPTDFKVTRWTRTVLPRTFWSIVYGKNSDLGNGLGVHTNPTNGVDVSCNGNPYGSPKFVVDFDEGSLTMTHNLKTTDSVNTTGWGGFTPGWTHYGTTDSYSGPYTFDLDPPFPKTNQQTLTFAYKITLSRL